MAEKKVVSLTMFDFIKGIAMITVLLHHSLTLEMQDNIYTKIMMSVSMPMFFLTSGFWLKKKKMDKAIKDTYKFVLKQYLLVAAVVLGIAFVHRLMAGKLTEWFSEFLVPFVLGISGTRVGPVWFVWALALSWIIFHFVTNRFEEKVQWILVVLMAFLGGILCTDFILIPFQIPQALIGQFFVYVGYQIKKKGFFEKKTPWYWMAGMLIIWSISVFYGKMDLALYDVRLGLFSIIGSMCGSIIVLKVVLPLNHMEFPFKEQIMTIGHYSMWILCVHSVETAVVPWKILFRIFEQGSIVGTIIQLILRSIIVFMGCVFLKKWPAIRQRIIGREV